MNRELITHKEAREILKISISSMTLYIIRGVVSGKYRYQNGKIITLYDYEDVMKLKNKLRKKNNII